MGRSRAYKKGEPFRDARLFVIACEGAKREKEYFEYLSRGLRRVKVRVIAPGTFENADNYIDSSLSAPKWVVNRLLEYIEKEGVSVVEGDIVWIVIDVDNWKEEYLYELAQTCKDQGWFLALSNPCFEVWLFMHIKSTTQSTAKTSKEFKSELGSIIKGGYKLEEFIPLIPNAIARADDLHDDPERPIPAFGVSRVHLLLKQIGELFIQSKI